MEEDAVTQGPNRRAPVGVTACANDPRAQLTLTHELGHFLHYFVTKVFECTPPPPHL